MSVHAAAAVLQRESFIKAVSSSSIQLFLEWFSSTQMFEMFITDELAGRSHGQALVCSLRTVDIPNLFLFVCLY